MDLFLNKLEFPSPKDALCQVNLKLAQWFLRRRLLNFINVYSLFHNYLPLEKDVAVDLNIFESPSPKDSLCQVWLKLALVLEKKMKMWKVYRRTDRQTTDNRRSEKLTWAYSSGERTIWAPVIVIHTCTLRQVDSEIFFLPCFELVLLLKIHAL